MNFRIWTYKCQYYDKIKEYSMGQACWVHGTNYKYLLDHDLNIWREQIAWEIKALMEDNIIHS